MRTGYFSESYGLVQPQLLGSKHRLIPGSPLDCTSLEVRSDLSGAFWLYNPGIESISDVIYFFFLFNSNPTFPLICLFSVHLLIFVIAKFLLCRMKEELLV